MGMLRWYKRYPDDALNGMAILTLEECGAYNRVLDLLYLHDGALRDDETELARMVRCDVRVWRRIRRRLIDLEKLYLHAGCLRNPRVDHEVDLGRKLVASSRQAGLISGETRRAQRKNANDLAGTLVRIPFEHTRTRKKDTSF